MLDYPAIDLYRFGRSDRESWQLIQFAVQVTSYLSFEEKQYIPLLSTPIPQLYLKRWLQKDKKEQRIQSIKEELLRGFELLPEAESDYLVAQLSGYQQTGKVPQQLTSDKTALEQRLWHTQAVHHLLQLIMYGGNYPALQTLVWPYLEKNLNQSMQETQRLLTEGKTLQEIAEQRKIKLSTIHDHLLELAIQGQLQASVYLEKEAMLQKLAQIEQDPRLWVYRDWRAQEATLSYLDFRLYQIQQIWQEKE